MAQMTNDKIQMTKQEQRQINKKKKRPSKKRAKLLPYTAGKLPIAVSKVMPSVASAVPLVSRAVPLVSGAIPLVSGYVPLVSTKVSLVSATPRHTLAKKWGLPPKQWGTSKVRAIRRREPKRPKDIGLFKALGETIVSPVIGPMKIVEGIASAVKVQAEEEKEPKVALEQELLELKMRREMNEISEDDYKIQETKLRKRIRNATAESAEKSKSRKGKR